MTNPQARTRRDNLLRHLALAFVFAAVVYVVSYYFLEHLRNRKGGWRVTFQTDAGGQPSLRIAQPHLGISNVLIDFPGARTTPPSSTSTVVFARPITNVPFGKVVYLDTTFLPGALVFDLFGHEVQLLPRVLMIDRREVPWETAATNSPARSERKP